MQVGETTWKYGEISTSYTYFNIKDLKPNTKYELMVRARNKKGLSAEPDPPSTFITPTGTQSMNCTGGPDPDTVIG